MSELEPPFDTPESGTVAYTEADARPSAMTWEGVVAGYGDVARTATGGSGWRRIAAYAVAVIVLAPFAAALVLGFVSAIKHL